jgi:cell division protein FtsI/penicillin-binding protein 2
VSNFVGFVPADKPRAVILVMVNNPKAGKYYGATVAGPVFKRLAKTVIRRLHIPPTFEPATDQAALAKSDLAKSLD